MTEKIDVIKWLDRMEQFPVFDVRTPSEYEHAHIPGALSLPLFSDEERAQVGTDYVQKGREQAVKLGLQLIGPKMLSFIERAESVCGKGKTLGLYCWRGGMRSESMAWLLSFYGFHVFLLRGGYQSYRRFALTQFEESYRIKVLGGRTGSAKTEILKAMAWAGEAVLDLEALACHKGSAFGSLGQPEQPSQEQFENALALNLLRLKDKSFWMEDESRKIGKISIPKSFFDQAAASPVFFIERPRMIRKAFLLLEYGRFSREALQESILRVKDRLGDENTRKACDWVAEGDLDKACDLLLDYYDRGYDHSLKRKGVFQKTLDLGEIRPKEDAEKLREWEQKF